MRSVPSKMHIGRSSEPTATTNTPLRSAANSRPTVVDVIRAFVDELVASGRSRGRHATRIQQSNMWRPLIPTATRSERSSPDVRAHERDEARRGNPHRAGRLNQTHNGRTGEPAICILGPFARTPSKAPDGSSTF